MKLKIAAFLAACLFIAPTFLFAQVNHTLSGKVTSADSKPLEGAAIYLYRAADSSLVKTALADAAGKFTFSPAAGSYRILVGMIGFQTYKGNAFTFDKDIELPTVVLTGGETMVKEVAISGNRPLVQQKIDRTVVNPESMVTAAGGTALDVLEKSPGVMVDQNAAISLKGKSVTIFVDDKPVYVSGEQLESYLRGISASAIDQIELMPNPPARYDAAGNGGVINIRTKKMKATGFNGGINLAYTQGRYGKHNDNANFNYRHNQLNLFGNVGYNRQNSFNDLDINRHFFDNSGTLFNNFFQNSFIRNQGNNFNARLGMDYYASEKTTFGINLTGQYTPRDTRTPVTSLFSNAAGVLDSTVLAQNHEHQLFRNGGINLNYRHEFDKNGHQLSFDADYLVYNSNVDQSFDNASYSASGAIKTHDLLSGELPSDIKIYSAKADYDHPLANGLKLSGGVKTSYTSTDNVANYSYTVANVTKPDYNKTNHFLYSETINAAYINANRDFKRFSFQLGLRMENTISNGHQLGNVMKKDSTFRKSYASLFPTAYLQYKLDTAGNNILNLNYGRRIDRPYYEDMNPFMSPLDKFTYYTGNPFLKPSYTNEFELSHTFKNKLTTSLSYSSTRDNVDETIEIVNGIYYSRPGNIGRSTTTTLSFNGAQDFTKWLNMQFNGRVAQIHSVSDFYTGKLDSKGTYFFVRGVFTFRPGNDWNIQLEGGYQSKLTNAQFDIGDRGRMNLGVSKKLSNSTTVKIVGNDLLYTFKNTGVINNLKNTTANWRNLGDSRTIVFSLSYRFGKAIAGQRNHEANGAESEQSRVKN